MFANKWDFEQMGIYETESVIVLSNEAVLRDFGSKNVQMGTQNRYYLFANKWESQQFFVTKWSTNGIPFVRERTVLAIETIK